MSLVERKRAVKNGNGTGTGQFPNLSKIFRILGIETYSENWAKSHFEAIALRLLSSKYRRAKYTFFGLMFNVASISLEKKNCRQNLPSFRMPP